MSLIFRSRTAPSGLRLSLKLPAPSLLSTTINRLNLRIGFYFSITVCCPVYIKTHSTHPSWMCTVESTPSCLAAYLWAADNYSLDKVKLAYAGEWGLLKTVMTADFMQFLMKGFVQQSVFRIPQGLTAERNHLELLFTFHYSSNCDAVLIQLESSWTFTHTGWHTMCL